MKKRLQAAYANFVETSINHPHLNALKEKVAALTSIEDPVERALVCQQVLDEKSGESSLTQERSDFVGRIMSRISMAGLLTLIGTWLLPVGAVASFTIFATSAAASFGVLMSFAEFMRDTNKPFADERQKLRQQVAAVANGTNIEQLQASPLFVQAVKTFPNLQYNFQKYAGQKALKELGVTEAGPTPVVNMSASAPRA